MPQLPSLRSLPESHRHLPSLRMSLIGLCFHSTCLSVCIPTNMCTGHMASRDLEVPEPGRRLSWKSRHQRG